MVKAFPWHEILGHVLKDQLQNSYSPVCVREVVCFCGFPYATAVIYFYDVLTLSLNVSFELSHVSTWLRYEVGVP